MRYLGVGICVGILLGSLTYANAQSTKTIIMRDACDPDSFNAADENKLIEEAKAAALKMGLEIDRENLHPLVQKAISELGGFDRISSRTIMPFSNSFDLASHASLVNHDGGRSRCAPRCP